MVTYMQERLIQAAEIGNTRRVKSLGLFSLATQERKTCIIALSKKYQGREELLKPKDGAGTRTNECKQS